MYLNQLIILFLYLIHFVSAPINAMSGVKRFAELINKNL